MSGTGEIREAGLGDAGALAALLAEVGPDRGPEHARARYIQHPDQVASLVATGPQGAVIGFAALRLMRAGNLEGLPPGWGLVVVHVAAAQRRRGIGRALAEAVFEAARAAGITRLEAQVPRLRPEAPGFFVALGFVPARDLGGALGLALALDARPLS